MTIQEYQRFDLAANQLETAIMLFLTGMDRFSVITLAGAADVIFSELVTRKGKENFIDFLLKKYKDTRSRQKVGAEVNDKFFINALKHFDPGDNEYVSFDVEECAIGALLKAIVNYNMLEGKNQQLIRGFLFWCKKNLDKKYNLNDINQCDFD